MVAQIDIYPYSIDEGFIDLSSSLNYFVPEKQLSRKQKLDLISAKNSERHLETKLASIQPLVCPTLTPYLLNLTLDNEAKKKHQP